MQFAMDTLNIKIIIHMIVKTFTAYVSVLTSSGSFCTLSEFIIFGLSKLEGNCLNRRIKQSNSQSEP